MSKQLNLPADELTDKLSLCRRERWHLARSKTRNINCDEGRSEGGHLDWPGSKQSWDGLSKWMKTGANGFNETGSALKVSLKIILQAPMAHSDLVHVKQEGDTCKPLRGPDHNISVYEGQRTWSWMSYNIMERNEQLNFQAYFGRSSGCWSRVTKAVPT